MDIIEDDQKYMGTLIRTAMAIPAPATAEGQEVDTRSSPKYVLFLLIVTLLIYVQATRFPFLVYDDTAFVVHNSAVHEWTALPSYFTGASSDIAGSAPASQVLYRPVTSCWVLFNYKLFGLHPSLWHLSGIALYVLGVWLLYRIAWKLTRNDFVAIASALIYGLHPMHVEGVVWLSTCADPLVAVFFFSGFLAYLRWREKYQPKLLIACGILVLLGLLTKETASALPLVIIAHALIFPITEPQAARRRRRLGILILTLAAPTALYAWLRSSALHAVVVSHAQHSWGDVFRTTPLLFVTYLQHSCWPLHLGMWYDTPVVGAVSDVKFYIPLAICIAYLAITIWAWIREPLAGFLLLWWAILLGAPLVGLRAFPDLEIMHDRFTFIALAGLSMLAAIVLCKLPDGVGRSLFGFRAVDALVLAVLTIALGGLSAFQVTTWKSDMSMYAHAVEVSPGSVRPRILLANEYLKRGDIDHALIFDREALNIDPRRWESLFAYGVTLVAAGKRADAVRSFEQASQAAPSRTVLYFIWSKTLAEEGNLDEAARVLERGVQMADDPGQLRSQLAYLQAVLRKLRSQGGTAVERQSKSHYNVGVPTGSSEIEARPR